MMLSFNNRRGPSSSIVSGDKFQESLWERGRKFHHHLGFCSRERPGEPVPPEVFVEELNQICPVSSGDVLAGGHGHQAGVEDGGGHEAQLGWLEITQERSEQGRLLGGQRGNVFLLQTKSK